LDYKNVCAKGEDLQKEEGNINVQRRNSWKFMNIIGKARKNITN
jgi:hypothetical protein